MPYYIKVNIDFMKYKKFFLILSSVLILLGLADIFIKGGPLLGIDFSGGIIVLAKFKEPVSTGDVRSALSKIGLGDSIIQHVGKENKEVQIRIRMPKKKKGEGEDSIEKILNIYSKRVNDALHNHFDKGINTENKYDLNQIGRDSLRDFLIKENPFKLSDTNEALIARYNDFAEKIVNKRLERGGIFNDFKELDEIQGVPLSIIKLIKNKFYLSHLIIEGTETVGPHVSKELQTKAFWAVFFALAGMLIYIWIRFELLWGIAAVICLIHDVLITLGIFTLTNREINLPVIASFLTLIGYSINDTIVVYDRIRENLNVMRGKALDIIINTSINQTLSRTLLTSLTTLFAVAMLFFFGGKTLNDFSFVLFVGIITGTYSSIYIASVIILLWRTYEKKKRLEAVKR